MRRNLWLARFFSCVVCASLLVACSKTPPAATVREEVAAPTPEPIAAPMVSAESPEPEPTPAPEPPADANALERRFFAAQNDPAERIAAVQSLADVPPATALAFLNRFFPNERREDVKMEMLSMLGDLDHEKDRDNQLALCMKALAPGQPPHVRYVAVQTLADLGDPRARAMLISLSKDNDREIRAAAAQVLDDLREE